MKNLLFLLVTLSFITCSKDDNDDKPDREMLFQMIVSSTWQISMFALEDDLQTSNFNGFTFSFHNTGVLTASNGTNTFTGSWYTGQSTDPQSKNGLTLNITFTEPEVFARLSHDWDVLSTNNTITLRYISGDNSDFLSFVAAKK